MVTVPQNPPSKIGIGCYRMSAGHPGHAEALAYALESGCTLIDTATTYSAGRSETLVGEVLQQTGLSQEVTVISKAGYINDAERSRISSHQHPELAKIVKEHDHSIHPLYLEFQLGESLRRLQRPFLDVYLLHNPEYLLTENGGGLSREEFKDRVESAFAYLEKEVQAGRIRSYGVSANTLPATFSSVPRVYLSDFLSRAQNVSANHHFRWVQFPFNLVEDAAARVEHESGNTLLELCKENQITTVANRPFNMQGKKQWYRLADHSEALQKMPPLEQAQQFMEDMLDKVQLHLDEITEGEDLRDFPGMDKFLDHWHRTHDDKYVENLFTTVLHPILNYLYDGELDPEVSQMLNQVYETAMLRCKYHMDRDYKALVKERMESGLPVLDPSLPPPVAGCKSYLDQGLDHVLAGLRQKRYIDQLKGLF